MPQFNFQILLFAVLCYVLCSGVTIRDRVLIDALHRIERQSLVRPTERQLFESAMHGMFGFLEMQGDDYSVYVPYSEQKGYEESLDNRFEGVGIVFRQNPLSKVPEIVYPFVDSPAWNAGLRAGDQIVAVAGEKTDEIPFHKISQLIKGPLGTEVVLSVLRRNAQEPIDISVKRAPIQRDSVEGFSLDNNGKRVFTLPTEPQFAYLRITAFSDRTVGEVETALRQILGDKKKGLLLDLRGNPGGYIASSVAIANFFVQPNDEYDLVVSTRYRNGSVKGRYRAFKEGRFFDLPMVVLIDGHSASAAEILSACLQDYRRATIVGTRSFGKGTVQEIFDLPLHSGKYQLTDASYWRPSGRNIDRAKGAGDDEEWGVTPDPEGLVPASEEQQFAQEMLRDRRSNIVASEADGILADLLKQLSEEVELARSEKQEQPQPFQLEGTPPYYDPQLEKALEILTASVSRRG